MKITVDVDCTPEEARTFLGLPDVKTIQDAMMKEMADKVKANMSSMDPESLMKMWMPMGVESLDQIQKFFFNQFKMGEKK
ncbi:MAG: DUF6489 family protein [Rhodospirillales bacterium]|nr:DUF6489 family protein [Rhodospirillales bacterium]